ncbi:MAG: tetratricopeptide repeat protein [Tannerella sp.]|jgi:tetratricopeptide (TPR) repeat protein|nr:tetratricopeptide repeat protein [Tannerella sp.]
MKDIEDILQRYAQMDGSGTKIYFDADEVAELLDYFERENDLARYEKALTFGLRLHPENPDLKFRTCKLLIFQEQYEDALEWIMQTGRDGEGELELLKMECLCALDRFDEVRRIIEQKRTQQTEDVEEVYEYVASVLGSLGDKQDELEKLIHEGLALFPDNQTLNEEYCYLLEMQGLTAKALLICNELLDCDPYFADYWYMAGRLHAEVDDYDKAVESLNFAITCDDSDLEIKIFRAFCFYKNDLFAKAVREFRDIYATELQEDTDELIHAIASEYPVPGDFEDVCYLFEVLRNEGVADGMTSPLLEYPAYQCDADETPAMTARHSDNLADSMKQHFPDEGRQRDGMRFLHTDDIYPVKNWSVSSKQLATNYLTEKYHNN